MSKIIMFGTSKGGQSKSTSAILSATAFGDAPFNKRVAVVDLDPQKSVVKLREYDLRAYDEPEIPFTIYDYTLADLESNIHELKENYDLIILDAAGKYDVTMPIKDQDIFQTLVYCDFLFVPFCAGNFNLDSTIDFLKMALAVQEHKKDTDVPLSIYGYVSMFRSRTLANQRLKQDIKEIHNQTGVRFLDVELKDLTIYREADTITSLYDTKAYEINYINFLRWINQIANLLYL